MKHQMLLKEESVYCLQAKKAQDVTTNAYVTDAASIRAPKIALLRGRGPVCWDGDFYLHHNPDLPAGGVATIAQAWDHYLISGQFEGRPSRYIYPAVSNQLGCFIP